VNSTALDLVQDHRAVWPGNDAGPTASVTDRDRQMQDLSVGDVGITLMDHSYKHQKAGASRGSGPTFPENYKIV